MNSQVTASSKHDIRAIGWSLLRSASPRPPWHRGAWTRLQV